uniref:SGNH hydrolase-type esterase domain-containing protein n=1 Tax=Plectus sambesii TaxID=2011161 RepID=A0A914W8U1_9BILA
MLLFAAFFFLFYITMNWPYLLLVFIDAAVRAPVAVIPAAQPQIAARPQGIVIEVQRPRLSGERPQLVGFVNDKQSMIESSGRVDFSVCAAGLGDQNASVRYNWTITSMDEELNESFRAQFLTDRCKLRWRALREGAYRVRVDVFYSTTSQLHYALATGNRTVKVRDIWIVAIGDSFASGEGSPDTPVKMHGIIPARWLSEACHRSSRSWMFKIYEKIVKQYPDYGILFTYLPCTGAAISSGILEKLKGSAEESQMDRVRELKELRRRAPDVLLASAGGNDLGYADIMYSMLWGDSKAVFDTLDMRFFFLSHQLDRLAHAIHEGLGILPRATVFPHYFDLSRNELGQIDANCSDLLHASTDDFVFAEKHILKRINKIISDKAAKHHWTVVDDVGEIFERHGFCSNESFILSLRDSFEIQGNNFGAFHPIEEAHRRISESAWSKIKHLITQS